MNKTRPDVIEILEIEKRYHADQIKRINVAIAALKGDVNVEETTRQEKSPQKTPKQIQWTAEIKDIFKNNDVLTPEEVALTKAFNPKAFESRAFGMKYQKLAPPLNPLPVSPEAP